MRRLPQLSNKSLILSVLVLFLLSLILFKNILHKIKSQQLNLLIISIDTLRPDHMGIYGYQKNTTPQIDNWAKEASVFTNVRTMIPMTYPSFTTLLTGKDPLKVRIITNQGWLVSNNSITLAKILKDRGFKTAAFTTGALNPNLTNLDQGMDENDHLFFKAYYYLDNQEIYYQTDRAGYESFLDQATSWLDKNKDKKFSLWVHLMDPHRPYQPPSDLKCQFNTKYCSYIESRTNQQLEDEIVSNQFCQDQEVPQEKVEMAQTLYDGGVAYSDQLVGKILKVLEEKGLDKKTLVILYGDHGEGFDHNYYFNHRDVLYESAIKIPLIVKNPLTKVKGQDDKLTLNLDILPMILKGLGISFKKEDFDAQTNRSQAYFANSRLTKFAIIEGRYKYIYSLPQSCLFNNQTEEVYDLESDPGELKNLVMEKKDLSEKLKRRLLKYLSSYNLPPATRGRIDNNIENFNNKAQPDYFRTLPY